MKPVKTVFVGSNGIRAGWRLAIYIVLLSVVGLTMVSLAMLVTHVAGHRALRDVIAPRLGGGPSAAVVGVSAAMMFGAALIGAAIMARIEHRSLGAYGLPLARGSGRRFAEGSVVGFVALSGTLGAIYASGDLRIAGLRESGSSLVFDAFAWAAAFGCVGLSEEYLFRGYALYTLTTGTRFAFAAVLTSLGFAFLHATNPGETPQGVLTVAVFALVLCVAIWRTGTLWFGVGFHAAWDWGETYFYGTPDSGLVTSHALLATAVRGPDWLSGSTAGPEGSLFAIAALLIVTAYVCLRFTGRLYPWRRIGVTTPAIG